MRQVGKVSYELELPEGRNIHNVFHVSWLKEAVGQFISTSEELPPLDEEGQLELVPEEAMEFVWRGISVEDATWESEQVL